MHTLLTLGTWAALTALGALAACGALRVAVWIGTKAHNRRHPHTARHVAVYLNGARLDGGTTESDRVAAMLRADLERRLDEDAAAVQLRADLDAWGTK